MDDGLRLFNGPSSASKAALEAFADVYRGELKPFGVAFVVVQRGNMATGGPAKTAAALERAAESMTPEQRELYGDAFAASEEVLELVREQTDEELDELRMRLAGLEPHSTATAQGSRG